MGARPPVCDWVPRCLSALISSLGLFLSYQAKSPRNRKFSMASRTGPEMHQPQAECIASLLKKKKYIYIRQTAAGCKWALWMRYLHGRKASRGSRRSSCSARSLSRAGPGSSRSPLARMSGGKAEAAACFGLVTKRIRKIFGRFPKSKSWSEGLQRPRREVLLMKGRGWWGWVCLAAA